MIIRNDKSQAIDFNGIEILYQSQAYNYLYEQKGFNIYDLTVLIGKRRVFSFICGAKDRLVTSPFSAPFGGLHLLKDRVSLSSYLLAISELIDYFREIRTNELRITLPPPFYDEDHTTKQYLAFRQLGFDVQFSDVNHSLDLMKSSFDNGLKRRARRSLKLAASKNLSFTKCNKEQDKQSCYDIIRRNRTQRGYPLKLSFEQIKEVAQIATVDFFLLSDQERAVAAAIVYQVKRSIGQVIYWGNDLEAEDVGSMPFLASKLHDYYHGTFAILDIGPSSEDGKLNQGLSDFKESIGCETSVKHTLKYSF